MRYIKTVYEDHLEERERRLFSSAEKAHHPERLAHQLTGLSRESLRCLRVCSQTSAAHPGSSAMGPARAFYNRGSIDFPRRCALADGNANKTSGEMSPLCRGSLLFVRRRCSVLVPRDFSLPALLNYSRLEMRIDARAPRAD